MRSEQITVLTRRWAPRRKGNDFSELRVPIRAFDRRAYSSAYDKPA